MDDREVFELTHRMLQMVHGADLIISRNDSYHMQVYFLHGFYLLFTMHIDSGDMNLEGTYHKGYIQKCVAEIRKIAEF